MRFGPLPQESLQPAIRTMSVWQFLKNFQNASSASTGQCMLFKESWVYFFMFYGHQKNGGTS